MVSYMKKSAVYDDSLELHGKLKILPTFSLPIETCRLIWNEKMFTLSEFLEENVSSHSERLRISKKNQTQKVSTILTTQNLMKASGKL